MNEAHRMSGLIESSELNTKSKVDTIVADRQYGTIRNYLECYDKGIKAHICPVGKKLKRKSLHIKRQSIVYAASKSDCNVCGLKPKCTKNKTGRTVKRHHRQSELDHMRGMYNTCSSGKDIRTRQHLMERSFARSVKYGHERARWRG